MKTDITMKDMCTIRKYTKSQLKEYEKEIIDTYDYMRADERFLTRIARIQRELIDLNTDLDKRITEIEFLIKDDDIQVLDRLERPLRTTLKRIESQKLRLQEILNPSLEIEVAE